MVFNHFICAMDTQGFNYKSQPSSSRDPVLSKNLQQETEDSDMDSMEHVLKK